MSVTLYGIPNCDTVKKARTWLDQQGVAYTFHDFKKVGISHELVSAWLRDLDWETLVNRKGTTWRALSEEKKASIVDANSATALMLESPSVIKRPVLSHSNRTYIGFSIDHYQQIFKK